MPPTRFESAVMVQCHLVGGAEAHPDGRQPACRSKRTAAGGIAIETGAGAGCASRRRPAGALGRPALSGRSGRRGAALPPPLSNRRADLSCLRVGGAEEEISAGGARKRRADYQFCGQAPYLPGGRSGAIFRSPQTHAQPRSSRTRSCCWAEGTWRHATNIRRRWTGWPVWS